jgi:nicotinamidase-related amidase
MPIDITDLVDPAHTAVVINECQEGVIGKYSRLPAIAEETRWIIPNVARLVHTARQVGAEVLHALAVGRPDGRGGSPNMLLTQRSRLGAESPDALPGLAPEEHAAVIPEIGVAPSDFVVGRIGGVGGLSASGAVNILRNIGVRTLVLGGITLNAGVLSMVFYGIDEGFDVVVASDASGGFPRQYGEDVLRYTVRPFAPIATVDEIIAAWRRRTPKP